MQAIDTSPIRLPQPTDQPEQTAGRQRWRRLLALALILVGVELGLFVRFYFVLTADFPVHDGGMFYAAVQDVLANGFALPRTLSYNGGQIPFAYPPLAFYLAAFLVRVTGWDPLSILHFLPGIFSGATILPFLMLSRKLLASRWQVGLAVMAFAFIPIGFTWQIMGGGLTRSPGFFFALGTIYAAFQLFRTQRTRYVFLVAFLAGLTVLSHLEMTLYAAGTSLLLLLSYGRNRRSIFHAGAVALLVLLLTAPWWGTVLSYHGLSPFLAAARTGGHSWLAFAPLLLLNFTREPFSGLLVVLGILGLFVAWADGKRFLPVWFVFLFFLNPRKAATYSTAPLAMAIAIALDQMILPRLRRSRWLPGLLLSIFLIHSLMSSLSISFEQNSLMRVLPKEERQAMAWIAENTPPDSRFLLITSAISWPRDITGEWFPVLAKRVSLGTVQGTEWLPNNRFAKAAEAYLTLQRCGTDDVRCVEAWAQENGMDYTHIYVSKALWKFGLDKERDCCAALRFSLAQAPGYRIVYDGPGALVVAKSSP